MSDKEKLNILIEWVKGLVDFCDYVGNSEQKSLAEGIADSAKRALSSID